MSSEFSYYEPALPQPPDLNSLMELDHVIRVIHASGETIVIDAKREYAPEVPVECADDDAGSITFQAEAEMIRYVERQGWELMTGYSGQYLAKHTDAIMHASEYVGGIIERDILARPGLYAAVEVTGLYPTEEAEERHSGETIGWVVARKVDES